MVLPINICLDFTGKRCEVVNDPCLSYPCVRGSCKSLPNGFFRCECPTGFTGLNCDSDFNECESSLSNQCRNNSTCMNIIGGYWLSLNHSQSRASIFYSFFLKGVNVPLDLQENTAKTRSTFVRRRPA